MIHRLSTLVIVIVASACGSSCRPASHDAAADAKAIAAAMASYAAAVEAGDAVAVAGWWTEDALYMPPGIPTVRGRPSLESLVKGMFAQVRVVDARVKTEEIAIAGDLAYLIASVEGTLQPPTGSSQRLGERFVFIWRRQPDGSWKIARGVTTDLPVAK